MFKTLKASPFLKLALICALVAVVYAGRTVSLNAQVTEVIEIECPEGTVPTHFGCQVPPPPGVNYVKNWGALSYIETRQEWVFATGYNTESKAKKAIAAACKQAKQSCQPYLTFLNQCVAVARVDDPERAAPGRDTIHNGSTHEEARQNAISACRNDWSAKSCTVVATQCSINRIEG